MRIPECIACGLKQVFAQYCENIQPIRLSELQRLVSTVFCNCCEGEQADAMEALAGLLLAVHCGEILDPSQGLDDESCRASCAENCPSHQVFKLELSETLLCACGKSGSTVIWHPATFFQEFYSEWQGDMRTALNEFLNGQKVAGCAGGAEACEFRESCRSIRLSAVPKVWVLNIVWKRAQPLYEEVLRVLRLFEDSVDLHGIYGLLGESQHILKGFIVYGLAHYVSYVYSREQRLWKKFDDEIIRDLNSKHDVFKNILDGRMYPVGVIYEQTYKPDLIYNMTTSEWTQLKENANKCDRPPLGKIHSTPTEQLLTKQTKIKESWVCKCQSKNLMENSICHRCAAAKPGLEGWICSKCTFFNDCGTRICAICYEQRAPSAWDCLCGCRQNINLKCINCCRTKASSATASEH